MLIVGIYSLHPILCSSEGQSLALNMACPASGVSWYGTLILL